MDIEQEVQSVWYRIEAQLQYQAPDIRSSLRLGATDAIWQLEKRLGIELPEEVKVCYRLHDGQTEYIGGIVNGWTFFSLKRMCLQWAILMNELGPYSSYNSFPCATQERYPGIWHSKWLPFMGTFGPMFCIDLAPGPKGRMGQILWYNDRYKEYPDPFEPAPSIHVVASNIQEFFAMLANDLETGKYVFNEETGILWKKSILSTMPGFLLDRIKQRRKSPQRDNPSVDDMSWDDPNLNEWIFRDEDTYS